MCSYTSNSESSEEEKVNWSMLGPVLKPGEKKQKSQYVKFKVRDHSESSPAPLSARNPVGGSMRNVLNIARQNNNGLINKLAKKKEQLRKPSEKVRRTLKDLV